MTSIIARLSARQRHALLIIMPLLMLSVTGCGTLQGYEGDAIPDAQLASIHVIVGNNPFSRGVIITRLCSNDTGKCVSPGNNSKVVMLPGWKSVTAQWAGNGYVADAWFSFPVEAGSSYRLQAEELTGETKFYVENIATKIIVASETTKNRKAVVFFPNIDMTARNKKSITVRDKTIKFNHYSIELPNQGWELNALDESKESIVATSHPIWGEYKIQLYKNDVIDEVARLWPAKRVADDYRNSEKQIMIEQGVNKGQYELSDVVMGEEMIGNNKYYTMKYTAFTRNKKQLSSLYLHFPREDNNSFFIIVHYSETMSNDVFLSENKSANPDVLKLLDSLHVNQ
jgi:hypothetical protein